jgi:hypothetical protein
MVAETAAAARVVVARVEVVSGCTAAMAVVVRVAAKGEAEGAAGGGGGGGRVREEEGREVAARE